MKPHLAVVLLLAVCALPAQAAAPASKPPTYKPPSETAALAPGEGEPVATANCSICHSVDYITTQPSGLPDPKAFWTAEVTKMQTAYGAPISAEDAQVVVAYLSQHYR